MFWRFFQSKFFTLTALVIIFLLAAALVRMQPQKIVVEKRIKNFQAKISELERANLALSRLPDYFKSDAYLEREAKLKLNVKRPEEKVVFLRENDINQPAASPEEKSSVIWGRGHLADLWRWLGGLFKN